MHIWNRWRRLKWYEEEVRSIENSRATQRLPAKPVAFYGSSTIRLWSTLAEDLCNPRAVNVGFGGSTLAACAYFFERLIVPIAPCSLVIYAGDNDLGDGRSPEQVLGSFRMLCGKFRRHLDGINAAFVSIKPSPARVNLIDRARRANQLICDELNSQPGWYYIDVFEAMLDKNGNPRRELFLEDGLHMSRAGYQLWTELLYPHRNRIFSEDCSHRG